MNLKTDHLTLTPAAASIETALTFDDVEAAAMLGRTNESLPVCNFNRAPPCAALVPSDRFQHGICRHRTCARPLRS